MGNGRRGAQTAALKGPQGANVGALFQSVVGVSDRLAGPVAGELVGPDAAEGVCAEGDRMAARHIGRSEPCQRVSAGPLAAELLRPSV